MRFNRQKLQELQECDTQELQDTFGLGRLHSEDDRDKLYTMSRAMELLGDNPDHYRYYKSRKAYDQGSTPQCVGYSWRQFISSAPIMTDTGPSASHIYHEAQKVDEWEGEGYPGTSVRAGAKVLKRMGHISSYVWAWDVDTMAEWILNDHGTIVAGTKWYREMFFPNDKGFVRISGPVVGGHAYLVVGCNSRENKFRCLNSWGWSWGQMGRFWLSFEAMDRLIRDEGEACAAIEQRLEGLG